MKCKICGASCRCKKAGRGICCSCHPHKAAAARMFPTAATWEDAMRRFGEAHGEVWRTDDSALPAS